LPPLPFRNDGYRIHCTLKRSGALMCCTHTVNLVRRHISFKRMAAHPVRSEGSSLLIHHSRMTGPVSSPSIRPHHTLTESNTGSCLQWNDAVCWETIHVCCGWSFISYCVNWASSHNKLHFTSWCCSTVQW
jgi:hypothetical protein